MDMRLLRVLSCVCLILGASCLFISAWIHPDAGTKLLRWFLCGLVTAAACYQGWRIVRVDSDN